MRRKGFTLIELVIVIGVIVVLAALIFPVYQKARRRARGAACISNMRQIGMALLQYAQDFDGCAPPYTTLRPDTVVVGNGETPLVIDLSGYNSTEKLKRCFAPYGAGGDDIWFCPLDNERGNSDPRELLDHSQTSYFVDDKMAIWRPVNIDKPPVLSFQDWDKAHDEGTSDIFWVESSNLDLPVPFYMECAASPLWPHGAKNPMLRLDGSVVFPKSNRHFQAPLSQNYK